MDAPRDRRPVLVPLGGFLGAGKTTLILAASRVLAGRGLRAAAILNDQGSDLADTRFVSANGVAADEVTGGCFCCRFSELVEAAERLGAQAPEVIFAEAVGSCTDISATMLQPLKLYYAGEFRLAPYSVLVDPRRARELAAEDGASDWSFLFRKQIEEADLICFNKADLGGGAPEEASAPGRHLLAWMDEVQAGAPRRYLSALMGQGVAEWLDEILAGHVESAGKILDLDYQRYARAEASLAWLNCRAAITLATPLSPAMVLGPLVEALDGALTAQSLRIAHLKVVGESSAGYLKVSITANGEEPQVQGMLDASPATRHELFLNVRAAGEPETLQGIVERELAGVAGAIDVLAIDCFRPAPPAPQHRIGVAQ